MLHSFIFVFNFVLVSLYKKQIVELAAFMDCTDVSSIPYWQTIAEECFKGNQNRTQIIEDLKRHTFGGGNPGFKFLDVLAVRKDDLTIEQFRQTALSEDISRHDIANADFLKNAGADILMCNLDPNLKLKLAAMLVPSSGIADWEYFADEYEFPYSMKEQIKQEMKAGKHSAGVALIEKLIKDEWTIERLEKVCEKVGGLKQIKNKLEKFKT